MTTIYAGAAPFAGSGGKQSTGGLYRREFNGEGWQKLHAGLPDPVDVRCVEIHPGDERIVYAGTQYGLYRSDNRGDDWSALALNDGSWVIWSILVLPSDPDVIFLGTAPHAIFRSRDGGAGFERLPIAEPEGLVQMGFPCRVIRLAGDPSDAGIVYAGIEVGGVIRSLDGGESWEDCCGELLKLAEHDHLKSRILSDTDAEGMMDSHALAVSASRPDHVILATRMGLFESPDRALHWREMDIGRFSPLTYTRDVIVSPHDPDTLFATCSDEALGRTGSLYRSGDLGQSWERFDHGIEINSTLMKVSASRSSAERVVCAARKGQVLGTDDGGQSWQDLSLPDGIADVYAVACT